MRFAGQAFEIPVEIEPGALPELTEAQLAQRFDAAHRRVYFHGAEAGRQMEIVSLRFGVRRRLEDLPEIRERVIELHAPAHVPVRTGGETVQAALVSAGTLAEGADVPGPALIEGYSSTVWVPPGWTAVRDAPGNIVLSRGGA